MLIFPQEKNIPLDLSHHIKWPDFSHPLLQYIERNRKRETGFVKRIFWYIKICIKKRNKDRIRHLTWTWMTVSTLWFWKSCFLVAELWWNIFLLDALIFRMNLPNLLICLQSHRQKHCPWLWFTMSPPSLNRLAYLCPAHQAPMFSPLTLESKQLCFSLCPRFSILRWLLP